MALEYYNNTPSPSGGRVWGSWAGEHGIWMRYRVEAGPTSQTEPYGRTLRIGPGERIRRLPRRRGAGGTGGRGTGGTR